jgi:hypothetical protein
MPHFKHSLPLNVNAKYEFKMWNNYSTFSSFLYLFLPITVSLFSSSSFLTFFFFFFLVWFCATSVHWRHRAHAWYELNGPQRKWMVIQVAEGTGPQRLWCPQAPFNVPAVMRTVFLPSSRHIHKTVGYLSSWLKHQWQSIQCGWGTLRQPYNSQPFVFQSQDKAIQN